MRLINTLRLQIEDFWSDNVPRYAILSHTWASGELPLRGFVVSEHHSKIAFPKIKASCALAYKEALEYMLYR